MGYMTIVLDPTRVFVGKPENYGGVGLTLEEMVIKYDDGQQFKLNLKYVWGF